MAIRPQDMFYIPGSQTFNGGLPDDGQSGGLFGQVYQAMQRPQAAPLTLPTAANPMAGIPTMYTQQAPSNSLAPMAMYQAYKANGQMPATGAPSGQPAMGAK